MHPNKIASVDGERRHTWIDTDHAIIVDVEATTAIGPAEVTAAKRMPQRTEDRHALSCERLAADTACGSGPMLEWLVEQKRIEPHIPVFDKAERNDGTFSRSDFAYDPSADQYTCPAGKQPRQFNRIYKTQRSGVTRAGQRLSRARKADCDNCPLKDRCCPGQPDRKISRSIHEASREVALDVAKMKACVQSRRRRKKVEMLFAHLEPILGMTKLRPRGPNGARDEFRLAATAQNLRKLAELVPVPA